MLAVLSSPVSLTCSPDFVHVAIQQQWAEDSLVELAVTSLHKWLKFGRNFEEYLSI